MAEQESAPYPDLRFLNEFAELGKLHNRLPHWRQEQAAFFITFRLDDSIPGTLLHQWRNEREQWLLDHSQPWSEANEAEYHQRFSTRADQWMDEGHGTCLLADPFNAGMVSASLSHGDHCGYLLHSWVIMPNHVHVLMSLMASKSLSRTVANWKRFSAIRIHRAAGTAGALWQKDYFDRIIRDWDHFSNVANYIRRNPQKAGLANDRFLLFEAAWVKRLLS